MVPWLMRQNCNILSKKGEKETQEKNETVRGFVRTKYQQNEDNSFQKPRTS